MKRVKSTLFSLFVLTMMVSCGDGNNKKEKKESDKPVIEEEVEQKEEKIDPMTHKGFGPVKEVIISSDIDKKLAKQGEEFFNSLCTACHRPLKKFIGPAPVGILDRRTPEWVMNMIMNPTEMIQKDPIAKQLLKEANGAPMADQSVSKDQARAILEYFRTLKK